MTPLSRDWRDWVPEGALAALVGFVGLVDSVGSGSRPSGLLLVSLVAAVALLRKLPGASLALVWSVGVLHVLTYTPVTVSELAVALVAFGTARWGSRTTVVLAGLSIPAAAVLGVLAVRTTDYGLLNLVSLADLVYATSDRLGNTFVAGAAVLGIAVLGLPYLAGLVLRATARARRSEVSRVEAEEDAARAQREAGQAREIARLRDDQARLARDVHDVVGHSLAVILAQAESAQYLPDDDPARLKQTLATIATSARTSLQDVRQVLTAARDPQAAGAERPRGSDTLVDGVRASGHEVVTHEHGTPQPLPPDVDTAAYRVTQEMLTNAIRHGRRDRPVVLERHWPDGALAGELRIEVRNVVAPTAAAEETQPLAPVLTAPAGGGGGQEGLGLDGMRRRLEAVGGRLDVRRREGPGEAGVPGEVTFTATAWLPVRTVSR